MKGTPDKAVPLKRVLFLCIGNACRSQMAEGFARAYGKDILIPASAGLAPALRIAPDTLKAMGEKNIDLRDQFPKSLRHLGRSEFDLVINLSGSSVPEDLAARTKVLEWEIDDPVFMKYAQHCEIRDEIEKKVMTLILELRQAAAPSRLRGQGYVPTGPRP